MSLDMEISTPVTPDQIRSLARGTIAFAVPCHDMCSSLFAFDLTALYGHTLVALPEDIALGLNFQPGTYVHCARHDLLKTIMEAGADFICWIDSDMRFPKDALIRLMMHMDKVDVVGINYCTRGVPPRYVAIKKVGTDTVIGDNLVTSEESTGLEEVDALGFGFVLMKTSVLKDYPLNGPPQFWFEWIPERQSVMGEDVHFCRWLRQQGVRLFVDHDLSKDCAHQGVFDYKLGHIAAWKDGEMTTIQTPEPNGNGKLHLVPA